MTYRAKSMVCFFGWIVLHMDDSDSVEQDETEMFFALEALLLPYKKYFQTCEIKQQNFINTLHVSSVHNHDNGYSDDVINLFREVGKIARGSYGLLYLRLPEDSELNNKFLVYRLAKGILTEHDDNLLSPCAPVIE
ncbi:MAG: hypothetical protein JST82_16175 [Bacteroidetes bacterium]|nr:hypothetical protein [Bacteroidota bacterium]